MFGRPVIGILLFCTLVTLGCATKRSIVEPRELEPLPESFSSEDFFDQSLSGSIEKLWSDSFDDKILLKLIQESIAKNHNIAAASSRVEAAKSIAKIKGASRLFDVDIGLNGSRQKVVTEAPPYSSSDPNATIGNQFDLSASISWELDLWGKLRASSKAAFYNYQATENEYKAAILSLGANVAKAYFDAIENNLIGEITAKIVGLENINLDFATNRYNAGLIDSTELRLASNRQSFALNRLSQSNQDLRASLRSLEILLGKPPTGSIDIREYQLPNLMAKVPPGLPSELLERRPDILSSFNRLKSLDYSLVEAKVSLLPSIRLTGKFGTTSSELENLTKNPYTFWQLIGSITQPIFRAGELKENVKLKKAEVNEALNNHASLILQAFKEVEDALTVESVVINKLGEVEKILNRQKAINELAIEKRYLGLNNYGQQISAELDYLESKLSYLAIKKGLLVNRVNLILALGGALEQPDESRDKEEKNRTDTLPNKVDVKPDRDLKPLPKDLSDDIEEIDFEVGYYKENNE
ncbi:MAG: efflux transporter outer membrane subunit [Nitrospinota bacterium]